MTGFRKESFYIEKYGVELGKVKYQQTLKARESRLHRSAIPDDDSSTNNRVVCELCQKKFKRITQTHLKTGCMESITLDEYISRFPNSPIVSDNLKKKSGFTLESSIAKYGEELGKIKWQNYCQAQSVTNTFEYKAAKYNMSKQEFDMFNKSRAATLENFIQRHGNEEGIRKWHEYCERQKFTTTLDYFIEKFGKTDGETKWNEFCVARGNSNNIEFIKRKYNISHSDAEDLLASRRAPQIGYVSILEQKFVNQVSTLIPDISHSYVNKQFCIWNTFLNVPMFYDITSVTRKKIIEFNGDYWHANPAKYSSNFLIKQSNLTALEVWERDNLKKKSAELRGYTVYTVWESEYLSDPDKTITAICKWWNNES